MWILLVLHAFITIWFFWTKWRQSYWSRKGLLHPTPDIFFGNIGTTLNFTEHISTLTDRWYNAFKNAPYIGYYKFSTPAVVLRDPELINNVLVRDFNCFAVNDTHVSEKFDALVAMNAFMTQDLATWKRSRHGLVPIFTTSKIKVVYPWMEHACTNFSNYLRHQPTGTLFEAKALCALFTTENTVKCSFSLDAGCFGARENIYRELGKKIAIPSKLTAIKMMLMPLLPKWIANYIPIPIVPRDVDKWFRELITQNRKSRENVPIPNEDLLNALLNTAEKLGLTDEEIASHALTLFVNGFDTSSTVLSFLFYELARNPHIQDRVHREIVNVHARHNNKFTYAALQDMQYLECVIHESQRLNPIFPQFTRLCTAEYTLPPYGAQEAGVKIYPGTTVVIPVRSIHLDPKYYPRPETFDPLRFTEEKRKVRHKALYLPFGGGPKVCMGLHFGHTQVKAAAMTIVREFMIKLSPEQKPVVQNPKSFQWHAKDGIYLTFEPRDKCKSN